MLPTKKKKQSRQIEEDDLPRLHHEMMKEYGWIPLEELRSLPLPTLWGLWNCIQLDREREQKEYEKANKKGSRGRR